MTKEPKKKLKSQKEQENNKDLQKVYKEIGNNAELKKLQIQSEQINQQINASHKKATNLIITDEKKQLTKTGTNNNTELQIAALAFVLLGVGLVLPTKKREIKKEKLRKKRKVQKLRKEVRVKIRKAAKVQVLQKR